MEESIIKTCIISLIERQDLEDYIEESPNTENVLRSGEYGNREYSLIEKELEPFWDKKAKLASMLSREVGNIYTGSLYLNLISFLINSPNIITPKNVLMFSYGSGSTASMFTLNVGECSDLALKLKESVQEMIGNRMSVEPALYSFIMKERENGYNKKERSTNFRPEMLREGTVVLSHIDFLGRRIYNRVTVNGGRVLYTPKKDSTPTTQSRLLTIASHLRQVQVPKISNPSGFANFYKKTLEERLQIVLVSFLHLDNTRVFFHKRE